MGGPKDVGRYKMGLSPCLGGNKMDRQKVLADQPKVASRTKKIVY